MTATAAAGTTQVAMEPVANLAVAAIFIALTLVLIVFSPTVSGLPASIFRGVDFHWFPLNNPGLISIPVGFLRGYLGTVLSKDRGEAARFVEQEVRGLTGIGAAKATDH